MKIPKSSPNEFLLPDELGWECNDKIHEVITNWLTKVSKYQMDKHYVGSEFRMFMDVAIAELTDNVYGIIKKYQVKEK